MIADFSSVKTKNWWEYKKICNDGAKRFLSKFYNPYKLSNNFAFNFVVVSSIEDFN